MKVHGRTTRRGSCLLLAVALVTAMLFVGQPIGAEPSWSAPAVVYRTDSYLTNPKLVADTSGDVHLFFSNREQAGPNGENGPAVIMYSRLHEGAWSTPTDILVQAEDTTSLSVDVDLQGLLHVVWQGGRNGELTYSQAHVSRATTSRGWSQPRILSDTPALDLDIAASADDRLHTIFTDRSGSLFYRYSADNGLSWSPITTVRDGRGAPCGASNPRVAAGGTIHVVWTDLQLPNAWPPCGAFYSDSLDRGKTWASPVRIAGSGYGQINVLLHGPSMVLLAWNARVGIGERKFTWSTDGGFSWRDPGYFAVGLRGGFTGLPAIAADSSGITHLVTSVDIQGTETQAIYYTAWDGQRWTDPLLLSTGAIGGIAVGNAWLTIGNGNQLHVIFQDDYRRLWYSTRSTGSPPIESRALPAPSPAPAAISSPALTTPTANHAASARPASPPTDVGPSSESRNPFLLGVLSVAVLLAAIVLVRVLQRARG